MYIFLKQHFYKIQILIYNYEYYLDVKKQQKLLKETIDMETGLRESADWYLKNETEVNKKPYFEYIDRELS